MSDIKDLEQIKTDLREATGDLIGIKYRLNQWIKEHDCVPEPEPPPSGAVCIGNPSLARYPKMDERDCEARGVFDMQFFDNRIYISGGGDMYRNRGPVDVHTYPGFQRHELEEEQISKFRVYDDKLVIPGDDRMGGGLAFVYTFTSTPTFESLALTDANHTTDAAIWGCYYYVITDRNKLRRCGGGTPKVIASGDADTKFEALCATESGLFMWGKDEDVSCIWRVLDNDTIYKLDVYPYPGLEGKYNRPSRVVPFSNGALYASTIALGKYTEQARYLYEFDGYSTDGDVSVRADVSAYSIKDVVVRGDDVYMLVYYHDKNLCQIEYASQAIAWELVDQREYPAIPYSLELMNGKYYVGLGNARKQALEHSGEIWEITV